ncbi:MAG: hypothetical protein RBS91_03695 [Sulfurimonadaceae bacterium]|nr:hypothetical protein [Sulfurimonadaceae bacterium]
MSRVMFLSILAGIFIFSGCAKDPSSYNKPSSQWQQYKAKKALEDLDKE